MADDIFEKLFPNQPPVLTFLEPRLGDLGRPSRRGPRGSTWSAWPPTTAGWPSCSSSSAGSWSPSRRGRPIPRPGSCRATSASSASSSCPAGANDVRVVAVDSAGIAQETVFHVTRRLPLLPDARVPALRPTASAAGLVGLGYAAQRLRRRRAVRKRFNPYIAGAPVRDEDMFFGRQKLLARILNVLHHNSLMITGERRIGKTTFLYHLKARAGGGRGHGVPVLPGVHRPAGRPRGRLLPRRHDRRGGDAAAAAGDAGRPALSRRRRPLRRPRLQPRPAARDRGAEDAHRPQGQAGPAHRRGGRPQRVLGARSTSGCAASS